MEGLGESFGLIWVASGINLGVSRATLNAFLENLDILKNLGFLLFFNDFEGPRVHFLVFWVFRWVFLGTNGSQKEAKGSQKEATGSQKGAKGSQKEPAGGKREPKRANGEPKGAKREPKAIGNAFDGNARSLS